MANQTIINATSNVTVVSLLQPYAMNYGSIWLALLMVGLMIIAALKAIMGIADMFLQSGEEADQTINQREGQQEGIPQTRLRNIRDIARGRFGRRR